MRCTRHPNSRAQPATWRWGMEEHRVRSFCDVNARTLWLDIWVIRYTNKVATTGHKLTSLKDYCYIVQKQWFRKFHHSENTKTGDRRTGWIRDQDRQPHGHWKFRCLCCRRPLPAAGCDQMACKKTLILRHSQCLHTTLAMLSAFFKPFVKILVTLSNYEVLRIVCTANVHRPSQPSQRSMWVRASQQPPSPLWGFPLWLQNLLSLGEPVQCEANACKGRFWPYHITSASSFCPLYSSSSYRLRAIATPYKAGYAYGFRLCPTCGSLVEEACFVPTMLTRFLVTM